MASGQADLPPEIEDEQVLPGPPHLGHSAAALDGDLLLLAIYFGLRVLKRGKPDGYMLVLARFVLMSRFKRAPGFEEAERL